MKASIRTNKLKKGNSYTVFIDYGIVNGIRKREPLETFSKKTDAENYKSKVQTDINNNTFINIPSITFAEAIDEWMTNYVTNNCEPNTAHGYKIINENYLKPCLGHIPFKVISSPKGIDIINDYYNYLRFDLEKEEKKNLSYSSVKHHKANISGIFTYFMDTKRLSTNICLNTTIPKTDEEKNLDTVVEDIDNIDDDMLEDKEFITPEQAVQILNLFMNTCMMVPVCLATFMSLRRSEIAGILKSKVNLKQKILTINASRVNVGNKTIFKKRNKNKTSTRNLYIPNIMAYILELDEKRIEENKLIFGDKYIDSKFLCVMDDGRPMRLDFMTSKFSKVVEKFIQEETKRAEENGETFDFPHITLHTLRHLNISSLLANGAYLTDVKDEAGHAGIETTMHYTHNYTKGKKEIANKIDEIYSPLLKIG